MKPAWRDFRQTLFTSVLIVAVGVQFATATKAQTVEQVNVNSLIEKRIVSLGRLNGHIVYVTVNDIVPRYVTGKRTAIVISHFVNAENQSSRQGELGRRMEEELKTISSPDHLKLKLLSDEITKGEAGDVHEIVLNVPEKHYSQFPIDRLYVVLFEQGRLMKKGSNNTIGLSMAMPDLMKRASNAGMSDLIVPAVGYHNMDKNSIHFDDIFGPLFRSLLVSTTPENVYIVLYEPWATHVLEEAVKAINTEWKRITSEVR